MRRSQALQIIPAATRKVVSKEHQPVITYYIYSSLLQIEPQSKEPVRSISSYFAGVDPDESPIEPRSEGFDFLEHASIRYWPLGLINSQM